MTAPLSIDLLAAARPNLMKIARLYHALMGQSWCALRIVHTGQRHDAPDAFLVEFHLALEGGNTAQRVVASLECRLENAV